MDENEQGIGTHFLLEFKDSEGRLTEEVWVEYRTEEIILTNYVIEVKEYMETTPKFEVLSEGEITIGEGISGYEIVGKGDLDTGEVDKFRYVVLVWGKQAFVVGASGEPNAFNQQGQLIDTIVDRASGSCRLIPMYPQLPVQEAHTRALSMAFP